MNPDQLWFSSSLHLMHTEEASAGFYLWRGLVLSVVLATWSVTEISYYEDWAKMDSTENWIQLRGETAVFVRIIVQIQLSNF